MSDTASSVPPFIPGLLIVGLLIVISVLIGYRNYVRRANPRLLPGVGDWPFWDEAGGRERRSGRPEKPKIWEVDLDSRKESEKDEGRWDCIMPLSVTPLTKDPASTENSLDLEPSPNITTTSSAQNSRNHHINFLSMPPRPESPPFPPSSQLQVSILISMPSPRHLRRTQTRSSNEKSDNSPADLTERRPSLTRRQSTESSSSIHIDKPIQDDDDTESIPEIALGVTVMPWRGWEGDESPGLRGGGVTPS